MPDKNDSASVLNIIIRVGDSIFLNGKVDLCKELFNLYREGGGLFRIAAPKMSTATLYCVISYHSWKVWRQLLTIVGVNDLVYECNQEWIVE